MEHDDPAKALLKYVSDSEVECLVLGSCSSSFLTRYCFHFERFAECCICGILSATLELAFGCELDSLLNGYQSPKDSIFSIVAYLWMSSPTN